jgi:hypothetical protein
MEAREIWNEWVEPYDLFVSYSRADNQGGMVSALVDLLEAEHARFSPTVKLKPFFDKKAIPDGHYWENEIRKGIRQSKLMLAVLSENYFKSEWCRREWEEYLRVEQGRTYPGEALTPIFIVAPADLEKVIPPTAWAASARALWRGNTPICFAANIWAGNLRSTSPPFTTPPGCARRS